MLLSRVLGIDISHWQSTNVNWTQVKNGNSSTIPGHAFAYAKASEGTSYTDDHFAGYVSGAHGAGVKIGAYHYARYDLGNDPVAEADYYLSIAFFSPTNPNLGAGDMVPMLDVEAPWSSSSSTTYETKAGVSGWVNAWCNEVKAKTGAIPIVYTYISYANSWLDASVSQTWPLSMANYNGQDPQTGAPSGTGTWQTWQMWQYTDAGQVYGLGGTGVTGTCDNDVLNGDLPVLNDYIIGSAGRWNDGATVQTNTTIKAWASSSASGSYVSEPSGAVGTILQGPVYGNGYQRWQTRFKDGVIGWCAEDLMNTVTTAPAAVTSPNPANGATLATSPSSLSWANSTLATSYDVYLDGALKGNVTGTSYSPATVAPGTHTWQIYAKDSVGDTAGPTWSFTLTAPASTIKGRMVFYNNSYWDNPANGFSDDNAIDTSKTALLPGQTASFANYTGSSLGINGVMVDVANLPAGNPTTSDFSFKVGNDNNPGAWAAAPALPAISVRRGAGTAGSARIELIWSDNAIQDEWLQVTVLADAATGLASPDVFYFGNEIGETGDSSTDTYVNAGDFIGVRDHPADFTNRALPSNPYDFNHDSFVDGTDLIITRDNANDFTTALKLIAPPLGAAGPVPASGYSSPPLRPDIAPAPQFASALRTNIRPRRHKVFEAQL